MARGNSRVKPVFKRLGVKDLRVLENVADDIFDHDIDFDLAARFLADDRNILIVAISERCVIGQIAAIVHQHVDAPTDLFIENLGVAQNWRRRGVARRLLAMAMVEGKAQGAQSAWVGTEEDNGPANHLYTATGASGGRFVMFSYDGLEHTDNEGKK